MTVAERLARVPAPVLRRRPVLSLVPPARVSARLAPFLAFVVVLLAAGLLGLLVLNTVLARDAFRLHALKLSGSALQDREQALRREVEGLRSPQHLAAEASAMGMVRSDSPPAFLRLSDGAVLGSATAATAPSAPPSPGTAPQAAAGTAPQAAASPAAAPRASAAPRVSAPAGRSATASRSKRSATAPRSATASRRATPAPASSPAATR